MLVGTHYISLRSNAIVKSISLSSNNPAGRVVSEFASNYSVCSLVRPLKMPAGSAVSLF